MQIDVSRDLQLPESYRRDIRRAVEILTEAGCTNVYLFGSLTADGLRDGSDIDLAVRGCPRGQFFHLLGRLLFELEHSVDLVSLDWDDPFAEFLEGQEELVPLFLKYWNAADEDSNG